MENKEKQAEKTQDIIITFDAYEYEQNPLWTANQEVRNQFGFNHDYQDRHTIVKDENGFPVNKTKTFKDIIGHQVGQHWVAVLLKNGSTKVFKTEDISEIEVQVKE